MAPPQEHIPVLLHELVEGVSPKPGGLYIDCTVGAGGHAFGVLEAAGSPSRLLGLDADPHVLDIAAERLRPFRGSHILMNANFSRLEEIAAAEGFMQADGVYFDLGISSMQVDEPERGFSFLQEGPLDMRFDPGQERTAAALVNGAPEAELARVIFQYGEEPRSRAVARRIVGARPLRTTAELAEVVRKALPGPHRHTHPATRTFQAIRMWVNDELDSLEEALEQAVRVLTPGGRLAVISFHSMEDRIVKDFFQTESRDCICPPRLPACICGHKASLRRITRHIIVPSKLEMDANPRSRSAKLRIAERL